MKYPYQIQIIVFITIGATILLGCEDEKAKKARDSAQALNNAFQQFDLAIASQSSSELQAALRSLNSLKNTNRSQKESIALVSLTGHDLAAQLTLNSISESKLKLMEKLQIAEYLIQEMSEAKTLLTSEQESETAITATPIAAQNDAATETLNNALEELSDLEDYRYELAESIQQKSNKIKKILTEASQQSEFLEGASYKDAAIEFNKIHELKLEAELLRNQQEKENLEIKMNIDLEQARIELIIEGKEEELQSIQKSFDRIDEIKSEHSKSISLYEELLSSSQEKIQKLMRQIDQNWFEVKEGLVNAKDSLSKAIDKCNSVKGAAGNLNKIRLWLTFASINYQYALIQDLRGRIAQSIGESETMSQALEESMAHKKLVRSNIESAKELSLDSSLKNSFSHMLKLIDGEIKFYESESTETGQKTDNSPITLVNKYNESVNKILSSKNPFSEIQPLLELIHFKSEQEKIMTYSGVSQFNQMISTLPPEIVSQISDQMNLIIPELFPLLLPDTISVNGDNTVVSSKNNLNISLLQINNSWKIDSASYGKIQEEAQKKIGAMFEKLMPNPFAPDQ